MFKKLKVSQKIKFRNNEQPDDDYCDITIAINASKKLPQDMILDMSNYFKNLRVAGYTCDNLNNDSEAPAPKKGKGKKAISNAKPLD